MAMNESFSDLSLPGGLGVGYEGPEFIKSMSAIAKGKADVSVYGSGILFIRPLGLRHFFDQTRFDGAERSRGHVTHSETYVASS